MQSNYLGDVHSGKVRDSFVFQNGCRAIFTSNRISAFDSVLPFEIPGKGENLQRISTWFFLNSKHIINNHLLGSLSTQTIASHSVDIIPIEMVVRGRLSGSLWRLYKHGGVANVAHTYDVNLPSNLEQNSRFETPVVTPTSKAEFGHDMPLNQLGVLKILESYLQNKNCSFSADSLWQQMKMKSLQLFEFGRQQATVADLELVDTKFEFGLLDGRLVVADEILTPDSSRYIDLKETDYQLSKEYLRSLVLEKGEPSALPLASLDWWKTHFDLETLKEELSLRYQQIADRLVPFTAKQLVEKNFYTFSMTENELLDFQKHIEEYVPKKVLIAGNGAREFALYQWLQKLPGVEEIYCSPGNRNWGSKYKDCPKTAVRQMLEFAKANKVEFVIGGSEISIAAGLGDEAKKAGIAVLAPSSTAAQLESSKIFCKEVATRAGVPTAAHTVSDLFELEKTALTWLRKRGSCVIKFEGLAAGKGVFVVNTEDELIDALDQIEDSVPQWKNLHDKIVNKQEFPRFLIEEKLEGVELSAIALCSGEEFRLLPLARDYKRRNDGQKGPNTGGMGTVSPVHVTDDDLLQIQLSIGSLLKEMSNTGNPYYGFLFCGFMRDALGRMWLLECNCRLGDPETQVLLPGLGKDFLMECFRVSRRLGFFQKTSNGTFFHHDNLSRVFVVGAAPEYPDLHVPQRKLRTVQGASSIDSSTLFPYAIQPDGLTQGGRIVGALGTAHSFELAREQAYKTLQTLFLSDENGKRVEMHYRKDIGAEFVKSSH